MRRGEIILLVLGALGLAMAVIGTRWGVFTPDTRPDLYQNPSGFLRSTVQAWVGGASGLGQGNFNAGAAPVGAVVWLIKTLGAPAWMAVRIWRLLLLLVGAWGIRRYLGALMGPRLSVQARVLATVFWVVNPYVIVAGSTTPILLPYALLPWTMLAFLQATRSPRSWRWPAWFALAFFAQTGLNAGVVPFFGLLALPAQLAHARWVEGRHWRDLGRVVWRCGLGAVAVSLYWLMPSLLASGTGAGIASGTEKPGDVARTSSYVETARLLGNWPLYGRAGDRLFLGDYTVYLTSAAVLVATFVVPIAAGLSLWLTKARERLMVVVMLAFSLPVMVGIFPPDDPSPAGRLLETVFERVPATLAFRTTNKVGAVVVLAETIALVVGWRAWQMRSRRMWRGLRAASIAVVALVLIGLSAPLWNGGLYPLGYKVPSSWADATDELDAVRGDHRVLALPGGTGGNYRWGMRSPDDLFPSLMQRPVAVRNTVVGRGEPAGNFLSAFDVGLSGGALADSTIATTARYLGAGDVLVRNDLLTEEIGGPPPWLVTKMANADPGLEPTGSFGRKGENTVPGQSGRATATDRETDPSDSFVESLRTFRVADPLAVTRAPAVSDQVLVVGDGAAVDPMSRAGIVDGTQPLRFLGDLDAQEFSDAVAGGGRVVLTDTNRRRAWDINRVDNATSPTLTADEDIDGGSGPTTTRWPDRPRDQTVTELPSGVVIGADTSGFGLHPYGRPVNAFDGDAGTAWITGGFHTAAGDSIWIELPKARKIDHVTVRPADTEPSAVSIVRVRVGDKTVLESLPPGATEVPVRIAETTARRVEVTIIDQTEGDNPVGLSEIVVPGGTVRPVVRVPETLSRLATDADAATRERLADLPLDVVFTRARGSVLDDKDDEEAQLDRRFEIPNARGFEMQAELGALTVDPTLIDAAKQGVRDCQRVALLDEQWVEARIVSTRQQLADGRVILEGCDPILLDEGAHELETVYGWPLNSFHLASPGNGPVPATDPAAAGVEVIDRSATQVDIRVGAADGPRYLRLGEGFDERWRLSIDGVDAGPPILVDGYSVGWLIDAKAHSLQARFGPQGAVEVTFIASAVAVVGVTAIALLPAPYRRRRVRRSPAGAVSSAEGSTS